MVYFPLFPGLKYSGSIDTSEISPEILQIFKERLKLFEESKGSHDGDIIVIENCEHHLLKTLFDKKRIKNYEEANPQIVITLFYIPFATVFNTPLQRSYS